MEISMLIYNQTSSVEITRHRIDRLSPPLWQREKVVIIMGATGTGKSRLSIDLATRFPAEVINSDKMQMYEGLDIVTNKITEEEKCGVPHHLLGVLDPDTNFTATNFCDMASLTTESILSQGQLPIIVGGSNSYIEALVEDEDFRFRSKYDCCFLWIDVSMPVLHSLVSDRVDRMVDNGMIGEVRKFVEANKIADYTGGVRRAIGVPELDWYFRVEKFLDEENRVKLLQESIQEIKNNTCKLACRQLEKIHRIKNNKKWGMHRIDATQVLHKRGKEADEAWEEQVTTPSTAIVAQFLYNFTTAMPASVAALRDHVAHCLVA
ncbi:IPPT domain-containing protein [Cephalotus follicularis]|uniref:adenylate dimethylallyltransferase (ADP/ATP-dependent) n=1 Tax=Cephalotus follicularis TaxID=3775 RepID=A0A1Q3CR68_CEPFO|nr:IPPT domain-containing protein [Cephalotus follicularis]